MTSDPNESKNITIVTDNDECFGQWSIASALYSLFTGYIPQFTGIPMYKCVEIFRDCMVKYYLPNGGARPGVKEILGLIKCYKDAKYIDKVVMFTSSTNNNNWVFFLKDCLEEYANVQGIYDLVLHRQNTEVKFCSDGATVKCLNMVRERLGIGMGSKVIIIDDRPGNVRGDGVRIDVTPYRHIVSNDILSTIIDKAVDNLQNIYKPVDDKKTYAPIALRKMIRSTILDNPNGVKIEINKNLSLGCPTDQLDDTNLITKSVRMFIDHINRPLSRTTSDIDTSPPPNFKRSLSV